MAVSALWLWSSPEASRALRTRELSQILRTYRRLNALSQDGLAKLLGYDKTYISMIETRRRIINDVGTLRHMAHTLGIPVHALGVTDADDATFAAMMQFAESLLALAEIARKAGHAADAVNELWPLVARLEARVAEGFIERESLAILGRARLSLGVALGNILPEEKLSSAAKWTGRALLIAEHLEESELSQTLTMHGNELRKAGRTGAAIARLQRAAVQGSDSRMRATSSAMLARAAGDAGRADLFDAAIRDFRLHLDRMSDDGMLANEFTFREVHLRGLVATGRPTLAARLLQEPCAPTSPAAPQWVVIERITTGYVLLAANDREAGEVALAAGLRGAELARLPQQAQRAVRVAAAGRLTAVAESGRAVVARLSRLGPTPSR